MNFYFASFLRRDCYFTTCTIVFQHFLLIIASNSTQNNTSSKEKVLLVEHAGFEHVISGIYAYKAVVTALYRQT